MPRLEPVELLTPRLRLRWMREDDAEAHFALFSNPDVMRYLGRPALTERAQSVEAIGKALADYASGQALRLAIELRDNGGTEGALIGDAGLWALDDANRRCNVGYSLAPAHWGRGYAVEALETLLGHGFDVLGLNRVEADIDPHNTGSRRVLEKLGFRKEGHMPERWIVDGVTADTEFYGLLRSHWLARDRSRV
jgi:[ribosomal protein S5]-alanine N-acetyltransferase